MAKFVKWIGGVLGWSWGGPIGAILGFGMGSVIDSLFGSPSTEDPETPRGQTLDDFMLSFVVLSAHVMKADQQLKKQELEYIRRYLKQQFGEEKGTKAMLLLRDVLKKDYALGPICAQIRRHVSHAGRLQMMHYLFGIALSDGEMQVEEMVELRMIARMLYISPQDFDTLWASYSGGKRRGGHSTSDLFDDPYKILQVSSDISDEDLKKAYRKMAMKYHPDRTQDQSEAAQQSAKEMFQKLQAAYEQIKQQRGIS